MGDSDNDGVIDDVLPRLVASPSVLLRTRVVSVLDARVHRRALQVLAADAEESIARAACLALGEPPPARPVVLLRLAADSRCGGFVDARVADKARDGAVLMAPEGYDFGPVWAETKPHKTTDLPSEVETGLCDAGQAFVAKHARAFGRLFGTRGRRLHFNKGFTNVSVSVLQQAIRAVGDEPIDADRLIPAQE
jgi:hypothetical protein